MTTVTPLHQFRTATGLVPSAVWLAQIREARALDPTKLEDAQLARDPYCPPEILDELAGHWSDGVRTNVAYNPNTSVATLRRLAQDHHWETRMWVAARAGLEYSDYAQLGQDVEDKVAERICINPATPPDLLRWLYDNSQGRLDIVKNPNCPTDLLAGAISNQLLAEQIALNPGAPAEILWQLWGGEHPVGDYLAKNPGAPADLLEAIFATEGQDVRSELASNRNCPPDILWDILLAVSRYERGQLPRLNTVLAGNPGIPEDLATSLFDSDSDLRTTLASTTHHQNLLEWCAGHPDLEVRAGAAINPHLTFTQFNWLAGDSAGSVRRLTYSHRLTTRNMLLHATLNELLFGNDLRTDLLPNLDYEVALRAVILAGTWHNRSLGELLDTAQMLGA